MESYDPHQIEDKWYSFWDEQGFFNPDTQEGPETYAIVIPPPNVTGQLHIGHALVNTLQDVVIRWKRMQGHKTLWLPGTDHAGIATQMVVERELATQGVTKESLGREKFEETVWEWKRKYGGIITNQLRKLGASLDWSRERFTLDEGLSKAVRKCFNELYQKGLIYRGDYIVNWCPSCKTAISDLEVDHKDSQGTLTHIAYPFEDGSGELVVATTRPETMLGDTAVAVNPEDERFKGYIGKMIRLPLTGRIVPVVGDEFVDTEFGTGAVKVTPAHDPNDFLIGKRHDLPSVEIFTKEAKINGVYPPLEGMDRFEARKQVVEQLKKEGFFRLVEEHSHAVGTCHRCKTVIEPLQSTQWFCKMDQMAQRSLEAVKSGELELIPDYQTKVFDEWMTNIQDWCLSRQLWWGHRIPAWYCDDCYEITVTEVERLESCPKCNSMRVRQDPDVLDTWFSSGLFPFSTMGWPDETQDLKDFYPNAVLITGYDILFFWVARMVMMGLEFTDKLPFKQVFLHGLVRDEKGEKMSKTKGNVIDPLEIVNQYGADALRFSLVSLTTQGRDIKLPEKSIESSRNFINKMWNATRFTLHHIERLGEPKALDSRHAGLFDRWILARLEKTTKDVDRYLTSYRFDEAAKCLYNFAWGEFCDWYVEIVKPMLFGKLGETEQASALWTLCHVLETTLRLLHPFMPFVTEELWQKLPGASETVMLAEYPKAESDSIDEEAVVEAEALVELVGVIRNIRGENQIKPQQKVSTLVVTLDQSLKDNLTCFSEVVYSLAGIKKLEVRSQFDKAEGYAAGVGKGFEVFLDLSESIDAESEIKRLEKDKAKLDKKKSQVEKKLSNPDFLEKAKPEVIDKNRAELAELVQKVEKLDQNILTMRSLVS